MNLDNITSEAPINAPTSKVNMQNQDENPPTANDKGNTNSNQEWTRVTKDLYDDQTHKHQSISNYGEKAGPTEDNWDISYEHWSVHLLLHYVLNLILFILLSLLN